MVSQIRVLDELARERVFRAVVVDVQVEVGEFWTETSVGRDDDDGRRRASGTSEPPRAWW